jgi:hypothetical protein
VASANKYKSKRAFLSSSLVPLISAMLWEAQSRSKPMMYESVYAIIASEHNGPMLAVAFGLLLLRWLQGLALDAGCSAR